MKPNVREKRSRPPRPRQADEDALCMPSEAAEYLHVTERWIRRAIAERRIPYVKVGRLVRFRKSDLDAYIEAQRVPAEGR